MQCLCVSTCVLLSYVLEDGPLFWYRMSLLVNWNIRSQVRCHVLTLPCSHTCCLSFFVFLFIPLSIPSRYFGLFLFIHVPFLLSFHLTILAYIYIYAFFLFSPSILFFLFRHFPVILSDFPYNFPPIFPSSSLSCFFPLIPYLTQNVPRDRRRYIFWLCNLNRRILQYRTVTRYAVEFLIFLGSFAKLLKATIIFVMSIPLSDRMVQLDSHGTVFN